MHYKAAGQDNGTKYECLIMCHTGEDNQYFTHSHGCDDGASNKALQIMSRLHLATQQRWNTNEPLQGKSRKRRASSSSSGGGVGMTASGVAINNHTAGSSGGGSGGSRGLDPRQYKQLITTVNQSLIYFNKGECSVVWCGVMCIDDDVNSFDDD